MRKVGTILAIIFEILFLIFWLTVGLIWHLYIVAFCCDAGSNPNFYRDFSLRMIILFLIPLSAIINSLIGTIHLHKKKKLTILNKICFFLQFGSAIFWLIIFLK